MERREKLKEFFSRDVMWSPEVLVKIFDDVATLRSHLISLFDL